jgi:hypothetical protein
LKFKKNLIAFPFKPNSPWTAHQKTKEKTIRLGSGSFDSKTRRIWGAAFSPATPQDSQHPIANTDSHYPHITQHTRIKQKELCLMQKGTYTLQTTTPSGLGLSEKGW